jgi:hypothetical protein
VREVMDYLRWEWRLFARSPFVWILAVLAIGHAYLVHAGGDWIRHIGYYANHFHFLYVAPFSIFALLSGVHAARRDRGLGVHRLVESLPYSTGKRLTARFVITLLPYAAIGTIPSLIWLAMAFQRMSRVEEMIIPFVMLLSSMIGIVVLVAIGFWIGHWMPSRISYLMGFAVWMVAVYGSIFASRFLPISISRWSDPLLIDYRTIGYYDDNWGFIPDVTLWLHRGLYSVVGALLILLLYWRMAGRRKEPIHSLRVGAAVMAGIVMTSILSAGYIGIRNDRVTAYEQKLESIVTSERGDQSFITSLTWGDIGFEATMIDVSMAYGEDGRLSFNTSIQARPASVNVNLNPRELVFTLNQQFDLIQVKVNGVSVTYTRTGDVVTLPLKPGASNSLDEQWLIEWEYTGKVNDWRLFHPYGGDDIVMTETYFADEKKLFLPAAYGWYPLPGRRRLVSAMETRSGHLEIGNVYTPIEGDEQTRFRLQVDYPDTLNLFTNLKSTRHGNSDGRQTVVFEGHGVACTLMGGALEEIEYGDEALAIRLIVNEMSDEKYVRQAMGLIHQTKLEIDRILQRPASRSEWVLLPISPEKNTGVQSNVGGIKMADGYMVLGLPSYMGPPISFVLTWGDYLPEALPPKDRSLWIDAINEYMNHRRSAQPIIMTRFSFQQDDPRRKKIEEAMNRNSNEQNEALLRQMYRELWDSAPMERKS